MSVWQQLVHSHCSGIFHHLNMPHVLILSSVDDIWVVFHLGIFNCLLLKISDILGFYFVVIPTPVGGLGPWEFLGCGS